MLTVNPETFTALGNPIRLTLLEHLSDGRERPITKLVAKTSVTRQAVSKHLKVLQNAGLVSANKVGRETQYTLTSEPIVEALAYLDTLVVQWDETLMRLKQHAEKADT